MTINTTFDPKRFFIILNKDSEPTLISYKLKYLGSALAIAAPLLAIPAQAQSSPKDTNTPTIVAQGSAPKVSAFITDGNGRTLYTLGDDKESKANCDAACMQHWQPYLTTTRPVARLVLPGLIDTIEHNGKRQVTYRGNPLYLFDGDTKPGDMNGKDFSSAAYMVSVLGEIEKPLPAMADAGPVLAEVMEHGKEVFASTCAMCHGAQGQGAFGTKLAGFDRLANTPDLLRTVVLGLNSMPAQGPLLSDDQIAAVTTYVRNSWGNEFGAVSVAQVKAAR
jgi:predicted lipoprotein with Yx(FWY)xxD motif/cytochrome c5